MASEQETIHITGGYTLQLSTATDIGSTFPDVLLLRVIWDGEFQHVITLRHRSEVNQLIAALATLSRDLNLYFG